jgi:protease-4
MFDAGYDHQATLKYIKELTENSHDKGILLHMDSGGGSMYHSDELYLALAQYKEKTGRPVHVYMSTMCASGCYWISMVADSIMANLVTLTGSLGVVISLTDMSGLFENLGLRAVPIDSGEHKSAGAVGTEITPEQEAVFQDITDEYYEMFVELIAKGRSMDVETVRELADGRIYSAQQALELDLIDEIGNWEKALADFKAKTGAPAHNPDISGGSSMGRLGTWISSLRSRDTDGIVLSKFDVLPRGVPLLVAPELVY